MAKRARGIVYSDTLSRRICSLIAEGASLATIGEMPNMPPRTTVRGWLEDHPDFDRRYEIARRQRTDNLVDEAIAIADAVAGTENNAAVQAAKLQVDTRRWLASKLLPERFGDQLQVTGAHGDALIPAAEPAEPTKIALAVLNLLRSARPKDADPQTVEHEAPAMPEAEPVKLTLEPVPDPRQIPSRTLLSNPVYDEEQDRRRRAIEREAARLKVVQLYGDADRLPARTVGREPRGGW